MIERSMIYQNQGLMDTLKDAFFGSRKDFGYKYMSHYKSTLPKRTEPELTIPLVALAATGVSGTGCVYCRYWPVLASSMPLFMPGKQAKTVRKKNGLRVNCLTPPSNVMSIISTRWRILMQLHFTSLCLGFTTMLRMTVFATSASLTDVRFLVTRLRPQTKFRPML